jgi:hypothetical protein
MHHIAFLPDRKSAAASISENKADCHHGGCCHADNDAPARQVGRLDIAMPKIPDAGLRPGKAL